MNKSNIITKTFVLVLVFTCLFFAQNSPGDKNYKTINVYGFYDSAHHWYDINDDDKIIYPIPDQKKYDQSEITKIADNILLFQKNNGGWAKNYDMMAILTEEQKVAVSKSKR